MWLGKHREISSQQKKVKKNFADKTNSGSSDER